MAEFLNKLDPIVAVLVLGNVGQYVFNRKDIEKARETIAGLTTAVTALAARIK
jgi:hypothetical protein